MSAGQERFEVGRDFSGAVQAGAIRRVWSLQYDTAPTSVMRQQAWKKGMERALDERQTGIRAAREQQRFEVTRDLMAGSLTSAIEVYFFMTIDEYKKFYEMVLTETPDMEMRRGRFAVSIFITFMPESLYDEPYALVVFAKGLIQLLVDMFISIASISRESQCERDYECNRGTEEVCNQNREYDRRYLRPAI